MTKSLTHTWTPEKLALKNRKEVEAIRHNAIRLGAIDLIEMCNEDLKVRSPKKEKSAQLTQAEHSETDVVTGYHFVCARDRGVTHAEPGRFWSGSWVVAEINVRNSVKFNAYLALHETKSESSYRQGIILDYRRSPRDMLPVDSSGTLSRRDEGIEFLVQETSEPYAWVGGGAGEKGYRWSKIADAAKTDSGGTEGIVE